MITSFNEKLIAYLVLISGLSVSTVAVYYSVVGLTAIFAASFAPIIIMGIALEISKLVATVWLKQNWSTSPKFVRYYLTGAVVVLMLITSMGIFGFLSKAHIEQTANSQENQAQIQRINSEIERRQSVVQKSEQQIRNLESSGTGQNAQIQNQIDREQSRIDLAIKRIEPQIKEQTDIIDSQLKIYRDQIESIDKNLARLQTNLDKNDIVNVQSQIGVEADGRIGPRTTAAIKSYRDQLTEQKRSLTVQLEQINNNPAVKNARQEIQRIRADVDKQISDSNLLITRLRSQLGQKQDQNIEQLILDQRSQIKQTEQELESLIDQKYKFESEVRKLEAEVGPIKYIAQFVYGQDADKNLLEKAVTWIIILLVLVFDPLAIVLLLASQISFDNMRERKSAYPRDNGPLTDDQLNQVTQTVTESIENNNVEIKSDILETKIENIPQEPVTIKSEPEMVEKPPVPVFQKQESKNIKIKVFKRIDNTATVITPETYQSISKDRSQEGNK